MCRTREICQKQVMLLLLNHLSYRYAQGVKIGVFGDAELIQMGPRHVTWLYTCQARVSTHLTPSDFELLICTCYYTKIVVFWGIFWVNMHHFMNVQYVISKLVWVIEYVHWCCLRSWCGKPVTSTQKLPILSNWTWFCWLNVQLGNKVQWDSIGSFWVLETGFQHQEHMQHQCELLYVNFIVVEYAQET